MISISFHGFHFMDFIVKVTLDNVLLIYAKIDHKIITRAVISLKGYLNYNVMTKCDNKPLRIQARRTIWQCSAVQKTQLLSIVSAVVREL